MTCGVVLLRSTEAIKTNALGITLMTSSYFQGYTSDNAMRERLRRNSSPISDGGTSERRELSRKTAQKHDEAMRMSRMEEGNNVFEDGALLRLKRRKKERGAGVGIAATIQDCGCCFVDGVN